MRFLDGFAAIAADYDGFICDLWGVVHDGVDPLEGAPECLRQIEAAGKRVVLLTNAPRRADARLERLCGRGRGAGPCRARRRRSELRSRGLSRRRARRL